MGWVGQRPEGSASGGDSLAPANLPLSSPGYSEGLPVRPAPTLPLIREELHSFAHAPLCQVLWLRE